MPPAMTKLILPALILSLVTGYSEGATLVSGGFISAGSTFALPSGTGSDWAYWNSTANPVTGPSNTSSAGNRNFSVSTLGTATSLLGSSSKASTRFTYSNGENPTSNGSAFDVGGIRNNLTGASAVGSGIQMTLGSFSTESNSRIQIWTYNYMAGGTMSVFVNDSTQAAYVGVIPFVPTEAGNSSTGKNGYLFTIEFQATAPADTLRFEYVMHEQSTAGTPAQQANANVGFQAAAITLVPEPASSALVAFAAAAFGLRRRR